MNQYFAKHGNHDQSSHGHKSGVVSHALAYDESNSVSADTKVSLIGGGSKRAFELVESHGVPQKAFEKVGGWLPSGSIKVGDSFNPDGSQGPLKAPDWKSGAWKLNNWGKRLQHGMFD